VQTAATSNGFHRDRACHCDRERQEERESEGKSERESARESVCVRERVSVCVCMHARVCACVCLWECVCIPQQLVTVFIEIAHVVVVVARGLLKFHIIKIQPLFFFLEWRRPSFITGLSGWSAPQLHMQNHYRTDF